MTDKERAQAADAAFRKTTIAYPAWKRKVAQGVYPAEGPPSQWGIGFEQLAEIGLDAPPPVVTPPSSPPFGSRPAAPAVWKISSDPVLIQGKTITGLANNRSLSFEGAHNVTIADCDLADPQGGIYLLSCTGTLTIRNVRTNGCGWNVVQLDKCVMDGTITVEAIGGKGTEDMISVNASGGPDTTHPLVVENCKLEGRGWTSQSGSGVMTETPKYVVVRNNSLWNPGQVGIGVHGPTVKLQGNRLYSDGTMAPIVRVGVDCADPASSGCEVSTNLVDWRNSSGAHEPYSTLTNPYPVGWATNDFSHRFTAAELASMRVVFP